MNKKIISTLPGILILFLIILLLFSCYPSPYRSHIPTASAGQISREKLITMLEKAPSREEREKICKNNRKMLDQNFVIEILKKARESVDVKHISTDKCVYIANIAVEVSEFTCDKISLAKSLLYRYSNDFSRKKNENPHDLQRALVLFKEVGDKKGEGLCYYRQALNLYHIFKKKDESLQILDKAIKIFKKTGDTVYEGDCYLEKGEIYRRTGDRDRSIKSCQIAVSLYERAGDVIDVITCYNEMYTICYLQGFLEEALTYLETEKELIEKSDFKNLKDFSDKNIGYFRFDRYYNSKDKFLLSYYDSLGSLYYKMGKYEQAIKAYKEAIETGKNLDDTDSIEVLCYWEIGQIYDILGQKESALKYYLESTGKNTDKRDISMVAFNYLMLGNFYLTELKKPDEALKCYRIALEKSEEIGIPMWRDQYKALSIKAIGLVYRDKGDPDKAIEYIEKSQDLFRGIDKNFAPFSFQIGFNYNSLAKIYQQKGDREKALFCLNKAFDIAKKNNSNISLAYKNFGEFYLESEEFDKALDFYLKAIKLEEEQRSVNILEDYYEKTGEIYEKTCKIQEAYTYYLKSIDIIEHKRQYMKVEEFKRDFMKDKIEVYEKVIDLLIKMGRPEEAFNYNEKARSRAFLDILANQKIDISHGVKPELAGKEERLKTRIQYLSSEIREKNTSAKEKELKKLKSDYEEVMEEIKLESPEYTSLISVNPLSLKQIRESLDNDTVIAEYFLGDKRGYVWIVGKDIFKTFVIEHKREEIEAIVKSLRETMCDHMTSEKLSSDKWKDLSKNLYNILFKDIDKYTKDKRLVIAPHRILHYLPFQVLMDEHGTMVIEKYEITYLPSASVLKYCRDKNSMKKDKLLAFELGNLKLEGFSPLPGTEREVKNLSPFFSEKEIYKGKDMRAELLYKKGGDFDVLHVATHGVLDPGSPLFSSLIFSDRQLPVYEIFNLNLKAYLVTLSACRTGLGEESSGDELVGLTRAFIYAGTPTICSSLWDVSDVATSELMERFYFHLKDKNKSEALRLAQIGLMKKYGHPFFWAPFVLTGDWR